MGSICNRTHRILGILWGFLAMVWFAVSANALPASQSHTIRPTDQSIDIDGRLGDPGWEDALVIRLPFEIWPGDNLEAPVKTRCQLTYDPTHLYMACLALDPKPEKIRARLSDRDSAWDDDHIALVLDPFNDHRRAFEFLVNPLGVQMDRFNDDVRGETDPAWDTVWKSAGRITDDGYVVELAIPFYSLRFPATDSDQTWGFEIQRFFPRGRDHKIRSQPKNRNKNCHLCQISRLDGLEALSPGRNLEIIPTLTASRSDRRLGAASSNSLTAGDLDADPGLNVKWGITPNLILNGTLNPDFSQVEADVAQLDVNTRFALFFPERRPFFLEGADVFTTPLHAVFTRNVADPNWGLKLTGKMGRHAIGVFAADDERTNLLLPGPQGSETLSLDQASRAAVLRYRRDVRQHGAFGALATHRSGGDYSNTVAGFDGLIHFKSSNRLSLQILGSRTEYPNALGQDFGLPSESLDGHAIRLGYDHQSNRWFGYGSIQDISPDFRADLGFLPSVGRFDVTFGGEWIQRGEPEDWYTSYRIGAEINHEEEKGGPLLERSSYLWLALEGPRQSTAWVSVAEIDGQFNGADFDGRQKLSFYLEIKPTSDLYVLFEGEAGDDIDFANTRPARSVNLLPTVRYHFGRRAQAEIRHAHRRLTVDGGRLLTADLTQARFVYQLNPRSFVRLVHQWSVIDRDPALYRNTVQARDETLFNQLLFAYKFHARTALYLGYSDRWIEDNDQPSTQLDRSFFFKIGYAWIR